MRKYRVVDRFKGSEVQIVKNGRGYKIPLQDATTKQMELLYKMNHPAVEVVEPPEKPKPKPKDEN